MTDLYPTDDLDRALSALHSDVDTDLARIAQTRAAFLEIVAAPAPKRRTRRWLIAAAAAAALVVGGSVYTTTLTGGSAEARSALSGAAQQVTSASDPVVPAGQFRHLTQRAWTEGFAETASGGLIYLEETVIELWVPSDTRGTWYRRESTTGRHQWIHGSDAEARQNGITFDRKTTKSSAACGNFTGNGGFCNPAGSWADPSQAWLTSLPKDPKALYNLLKRDSPRNSRGETELVVYAQDALRTGLLPAETRATLYRALTNLKHLKITDRAANLDGKVGIAYSSDDGTTREELVIDPHTGAYLGSRQVSTNGPTKGRILSYTSATTAVTKKPY
ncbi:CU044_5270 family protein [Kribbella sp. NPDC020789]